MRTWIILAALVFTTDCYAETPHSSSFYPLSSVVKGVEDSTYTTEGYVVLVNPECPPCPKNALCEMCKQSFFVAERKDIKVDIDRYVSSGYGPDNPVMEFGGRCKQPDFQVGKKYTFYLEVHDTRWKRWPYITDCQEIH